MKSLLRILLTVGAFTIQNLPLRNEFSTCWKIIASFIYFPFSGLFVILCLKRFSWMLIMIPSVCHGISNQCKKMFPFLMASWTWEIQLQSKIAKRLKDISLVNFIITFYQCFFKYIIKQMYHLYNLSALCFLLV